MFNITSELFPAFASYLVLTLVVLWIAISNRKNFAVLFIIIPLALFANTVFYFTIDKIFGYPISKQIEDKSIYLYHIESADGKFIHVWVIEPNGTEPRAVTISNTPNNRKQMTRAAEGAEQGVGQMIEGEPGSGSGTDSESDGGEYKTYDFVPNETLGEKG